MSDPNHINIDFNFSDKKPSYGDLYKMVGYENSDYPSNDDAFLIFSELGIEQADDFFGVKNHNNDGDDIVLWVIPLINDQEVYDNNGPFDGLRLHFNTLRNTPDKVLIVEKVFLAFKTHLNAKIFFEKKPIDNFLGVKDYIDLQFDFWRKQGLEPGSDDALMYDE